MILSRWGARITLPVLLCTTAVFAQSAMENENKADGDPSDATMSFGKRSLLTPEEQLTQTRAYLDKMNSAIASVEKLKEKTTGDSDIIKLNCIKDKLVKIKTHRQNSQNYQAALQQAITKGDQEGRDHQFSMLTMAYNKVIVLEQEAEACVGDDAAYVGQTRVDTEESTDLPQEDVTEVEGEPVDPIEFPPPESPADMEQ